MPTAVLPVAAPVSLNGGNGACWVRADGALDCAFHFTPLGAPLTLPSGAPFLDVAAVGNDLVGAVCAIRADGSAACGAWGYHGSPPPILAAGPISAFPARYVKLRMTASTDNLGAFTACGLRNDGGVDCWGRVTTNPSTTVLLLRGPAAVQYTDFALGAAIEEGFPGLGKVLVVTGCGVRTDGAIECFGDYGASGLPRVLDPAVGTTFTRVAMGSTYVCGLQTDGVVRCAGAALATNGVPSTLQAPGGYVEIAATSGLLCARRPDGRVDCAGGAVTVATAKANFGTAPFRSLASGGPRGLICAVPEQVDPNPPAGQVPTVRCAYALNPTAAPRIELRAPQMISFAAPAPAPAGTTIAVSAQATSGLPVTFGSQTPGVCTTTPGGAVTLVAPGTCTLTADQPGQGVAWHPAPQVARSFTVTIPVLGITLGGLSRVFDGSPKSATVATAPANVPVTVTYAAAGGAPTATQPTAPGSYTVTVTPADPSRFTGQATGTLVIEMPRLQLAPAQISLRASTLVTAYVYGSAIVDAAAITPASVRLRVVGGSGAGAPVATRSGAPMTTVRDFDGDGRVDRQLVFLLSDLKAAGLSTASPSMVLEDQTGSYRFRATPAAAPGVVP